MKPLFDARSGVDRSELTLEQAIKDISEPVKLEKKLKPFKMTEDDILAIKEKENRNHYISKLTGLQKAVEKYIFNMDRIFKDPVSFQRGQRIALAIGELDKALAKSKYE